MAAAMVTIVCKLIGARKHNLVIITSMQARQQQHEGGKGVGLGGRVLQSSAFNSTALAKVTSGTTQSKSCIGVVNGGVEQ